MTKSFWASFHEVVEEADLVIEVLDARFPELTRNTSIENLVKANNKVLVFVINKSDLTNLEIVKTAKRELDTLGSVVFLSAQKRKGIARLHKVLRSFGEQAKKEIRVAVVGYPNVGKSSLINALTVRASARVSPKSGYTRGKQLIRLNDHVLLIDSPGIIPFYEKDEFLLALIGAKSAENISDAEGIALKLVQFILARNPKAIGKGFGVTLTKTEPIDCLEELARAKKKLIKHNEPDLDAIGKQLITKWQNGEIRLNS
ncbi:MAG: GTPase [Candidatus Diapherotrites archaeon]|nr:GTPase [Candidatus Diapherotrites archaeon]